MFVSTVVPSTMLNVTKNLNASSYNFSIPYNFARGRNLMVNINPRPMLFGSHGTGVWAYKKEVLLNSLNNVVNRLHILIPDGVTSYESTMKVISTYNNVNDTSGINIYYTVKITFDLTNNIITFTPMEVSFDGTTSLAPLIDEQYTAPTLITVVTIL